MAAAGMPADKPEDLVGATRRLAARLRPDRVAGVLVVVLGVSSVTLSVIGPKILGRATDIIVEGVTSEAGIDFPALHRVLLGVLVLYVGASVLAYVQAYLLAGVVQRSMHRLRADVEDKINRLPLAYVDGQPRGDLLSRVTNDIDNVAQSLQQSLSQALTFGADDGRGAGDDDPDLTATWPWWPSSPCRSRCGPCGSSPAGPSPASWPSGPAPAR